MNGSCKEYRDLIVDQVLGLLDPSQNEALLKHSNACEACYEYWQALKQDHDLLLEFGGELDIAMPERMERCVAAVVTPRSQMQVVPIRRQKKMSMIIKFAAAAIVAVGISVMSVLPPNTGDTFALQMLATVHAQEAALFSGNQKVYILNEITVYPNATFREAGQVWLPMTSMKADGTFRLDQLNMKVEDEPYAVTDQAWYDPLTGHFVRVLETDGQVVFGNSYDGASVYTAQWSKNGAMKIVDHPIQSQFKRPESPADFFGLAAGMPSGLTEDSPNLLGIEQGHLDDGTAVHIYKVRAAQPEGATESHFLFRVRDDDKTVAEKEWVMAGETVLVTRRITTETGDVPGVQWNMADLQGRSLSADQSPKATVSADMVQMDVSVQHMIDAASFNTYMLKQPPAGIDKLVLEDINVGGPEMRMFVIVGRADDKRHIVLVQTAMFEKLKASGRIDLTNDVNLVCKSPRGFEIWSGAPKGMAKTMLQSTIAVLKEPPSDDCVGYGIETPDKTFLFLAVNGPMTSEELQQLADNLIPASEYLKLVK